MVIIAKADDLSRIMQERRRDMKIAEWYVLHYEDEKRSYTRAKAEYMARPADENAGRKGAITHPTESAALQSVAFDEKSQQFGWLQAVEICCRGLCDSKRLLITLRREAQRKNIKGVGRPAWVVYVTMRYGDLVGRAVSESTIRRWFGEILARIVDIHLRLSR